VDLRNQKSDLYQNYLAGEEEKISLFEPRNSSTFSGHDVSRAFLNVRLGYILVHDYQQFFEYNKIDETY